jgi:hypothetical protein
MLDLWQNNEGVSAKIGPAEGTDLPATFGDTFDAAWHEGQLFSGSIARGNAQMAGLDSYIDDVNKASGQDIRRDVYGRLDMMNAANEAVAKIRKTQPDLQVPDLTDDELNRRAVAASSEAHQAATDMAGREKTLGGKIGGVLGGLASGTVDPVNLVGLAVAPEAELGVLGTAAAWGGYGAASQAVNEVMSAGFRNQVEPGYTASDQPGMNVVEGAVGGAVLGGLFKGLGNTWTRMKTGEWPRSVRDAGNIVESEANIQQSNVLPGVEGEAAHRTALQDSIDQIVSGKPVDTGDSLQGSVLASYNRRLDPALDALSEVKAARNAVQMERAAQEAQVAPELPFAGSIAEGQETAAVAKLGGHLEDLAKSVGADIAPDEARALAEKVSRLSTDQATAALDEFMLRPRTLPDTLPSVSAITTAERAIPTTEIPAAPVDHAAILADQNHVTAMSTDLERMRDTGQGGMIPMGVDEKGDPTYRLLDEALADAHNDRDAAEQLESCINPPAEEEAQPLKRDVTSRGRSGRPLTSEKLPTLDTDDLIMQKEAADFTRKLSEPIEEHESLIPEDMGNEEAANIFEKQLRAAQKE